MGAWIEITSPIVTYVTLAVAPLVGAWIEMAWRPPGGSWAVVAPLVGAWIEICGGVSARTFALSLPSWKIDKNVLRRNFYVDMSQMRPYICS